ncbi:hypothetical protein SALBM311S_03384 [Streptomyces alboniger]
MELVEQLTGPDLRGPGLHLVELADHLEVLAAGQVFVDRRELTGQADRAPYLVGLLEHVEAGDDGLSAVGAQQGRQTADRGRLARAVRSEQAEDRALGDIEVDAVQSLYVTEGLDQTFGIDGAWHMSLHVFGGSWESLNSCLLFRPTGESAVPRHTP